MNEELVWDVELRYGELRDGFEHGDAVVEALDGGGRVNDGGVRVVDGEMLEIEVPLMAVNLVDDAVEGTLVCEWFGNIDWEEMNTSLFGVVDELWHHESFNFSCR